MCFCIKREKILESVECGIYCYCFINIVIKTKKNKNSVKLEFGKMNHRIDFVFVYEMKGVRSKKSIDRMKFDRHSKRL